MSRPGKARTKLEIHQERTIFSQKSEIARLRKALRVFLAEAEGSEDEDDSSSDSEATSIASDEDVKKEEGEEGEDSDDSDDSLPTPIYNTQNESWDDDYTPRCVECHGEVVEGHCACCDKEHAWDPKLYEVSHSTESHAISTSRSRAPRSTTPLLRRSKIKVAQPPNVYLRRMDEYTQLLRRGATRLMCETFHLEFTKEDGIFAWADQNLYEEFSGPLMQPGDFWKIHLGGRIELDEDDLDGAQFLEELLEDALYFANHLIPWETVEETPGIWVTRLAKKGSMAKMLEDSEAIELKSDDSEGSDEELEDEQAKLKDVQPGPIRDLEEYDKEGDEVEEDFEDETSDMLLDDPGWATRANICDSGYPSDSEMDEEEDDNTLPDVALAGEATADDVEFVQSDCDSDFDSDT